MGAVAGLGPATVIVGYYIGTGGPVMPGLLLFIVAPVVAGWLVGPRLDGTRREDAGGAFAFLIAAYLLHGGLGVVLRGLEDGRDLVGYLSSLLKALGSGAVVTAIYFPFWAVVLSPLALIWVVTARILRVGLRGARVDGGDSSQPAPRGSGSRLLHRVAAGTGLLVAGALALASMGIFLLLAGLLAFVAAGTTRLSWCVVVAISVVVTAVFLCGIVLT